MKLIHGLLFMFVAVAWGLTSASADSSVGSSTVYHIYSKPKKLRKFQVLKVIGHDAEALQEGLGKYLNKKPKTKIVGIRSMICDTEPACWVITSRADFFEAEDLEANENFDLSPFKKINPETEIAFLSPTLEQIDRAEDMSASSEPVFNRMNGKNVINYRKVLLNGSVESKTIRGEKIEIRCFHETTGQNEKAKHFYNCQVYAKVSKIAP